MRLPKIILPILVFAAIFGGYFLRTAFTQPSTSVVFQQKTGASVVFIVEGLKCKGTATFFSSLYENVPGIISIETVASDHKATFVYDPKIITPDSIRAVMEQVIQFDDGSSAQIFECLSVD